MRPGRYDPSANGSILISRWISQSGSTPMIGPPGYSLVWRRQLLPRRPAAATSRLGKSRRRRPLGTDPNSDAVPARLADRAAAGVRGCCIDSRSDDWGHLGLRRFDLRWLREGFPQD